jgi:hypothetical protein
VCPGPGRKALRFQRPRCRRAAGATDDAFALVLPEVNANAVDMCLAQNTRARVLLDQAGWHGEKALAAPM